MKLLNQKKSSHTRIFRKVAAPLAAAMISHAAAAKDLYHFAYSWHMQPSDLGTAEWVLKRAKGTCLAGVYKGGSVS